MRKLVSNVTNMNKIQAQISDQKIKQEVQEDTPDLIIGEKMRFAQILHNSLSNAMKHASNKVPIEVHCFVMPRGQKSQGNVFMAIDFEIDDEVGSKDDKHELFKEFDLGLKSSKHPSQVLGGKFTMQ